MESSIVFETSKGNRYLYDNNHSMMINCLPVLRFAKHQEIAKELEISFYFCKPYILGNVEPMRTRTDSSDNTSPKERTSVE